MDSQTIPSREIVAYTTNRNIFKTMDTDSLIKQMRDYARVLKNNYMPAAEREGYELGYSLCTEEFNTRFGIKRN